MRRLALLNLLSFPLLFTATVLSPVSLAWLWLAWTWSLILSYHWSCIRLIGAATKKPAPYRQFLAVLLLILPTSILRDPELMAVTSLLLFFLCTRYVHYQILAHACGMPWQTHIYHFVPVIGFGIIGSIATRAVTSSFPRSGKWFFPLFFFDFLLLPWFAATRVETEPLPVSDKASPVVPSSAPSAPACDNPYAEYRRRK